MLKESKHVTDNAEVCSSVFKAGSAEEFHVVACSTRCNEDFQTQLLDILVSLETFLELHNCRASSLIFARFFLSDYKNQAHIFHATVEEYLKSKGAACAVSVVEQPPLTCNKVVLWAYLVNEPDIISLYRDPSGQNLLLMRRQDYLHMWATSMVAPGARADSWIETKEIFNLYVDKLKAHGMSLEDNCVRTWLFVRDVDNNYKGLVDSRRELFREHGLVPETHFIASTGIEGSHHDHRVTVLMDAYAVKGINPAQVKYLEAPEYLNPTYEYGVTFERGTSIDYGDRRHIFISGTASIDNRGQVIFKGDLRKQTERVLTNISALLSNAGADMDDMMQMIVYLRDLADSSWVCSYFEENFPDIPTAIVLGRVCRPEWLIEIECIAVKRIGGNGFADF